MVNVNITALAAAASTFSIVDFQNRAVFDSLQLSQNNNPLIANAAGTSQWSFVISSTVGVFTLQTTDAPTLSMSYPLAPNPGLTFSGTVLNASPLPLNVLSVNPALNTVQIVSLPGNGFEQGARALTSWMGQVGSTTNPDALSKSLLSFHRELYNIWDGPLGAFPPFGISVHISRYINRNASKDGGPLCPRLGIRGRNEEEEETASYGDPDRLPGVVDTRSGRNMFATLSGSLCAFKRISHISISVVSDADFRGRRFWKQTVIVGVDNALQLSEENPQVRRRINQGVKISAPNPSDRPNCGVDPEVDFARGQIAVGKERWATD
ncbi:hypothetical protein B0H16DRAFT_1685348 [Mycena metata]|uniref:Uncharacterized protein n=1 Tax=Mycena metata TaxID=1033252 RepID=A0AAD7NRV9_9AGAR|nr:hypothetical protein B0H16DRAFT_1685348 [Mycena metata]